MRYRKFCILVLLFVLVLTSCKKINEIQYPYEIAVDNNVLDYSDKKSSVEDEIGEGIPTTVNVNDAYNYNDMIELIYNKDDDIRFVKVIDEKVKTFNNISIGDKLDKIINTYKYEIERANTYMVLFNGTDEVNSTVENKSNDWIWITYDLNDEKEVESISIYDHSFAQMNK